MNEHVVNAKQRIHTTFLFLRFRLRQWMPLLHSTSEKHACKRTHDKMDLLYPAFAATPIGHMAKNTILKHQQFKMTHQRKATKKHAQPTLFKPFTSLRITYTIHSILRLYKHNTHCLRMASSYVSECHVNRSILFCLKLRTRACLLYTSPSPRD